jgi:IS5 family transposase
MLISTMKSYQPSFFDEAERHIKLDQLKDPLVELDKYIDFEVFRSKLNKVFEKPRLSNAGRKSLDVVLMFKILILQRLYNLSDEQVEYQITDRISFCRFLELPLGGKAPDFTTVWRFRQALVDADAVKDLFDLFTCTLQDRGLITKTGTIVDASFVEVPKQRNTRQENELVKKGKTPQGWKANPRKLAQKDLDARWTKKNNVSYYGYKDHVKVDAESKLITDYAVTDASVHDSRKLFDLVDRSSKGENLFCDSAYKSAEIDRKLKEMKIENYIHEKAARNRPLSEGSKLLNHLKSQIRCLVEHIFGYIENSMSGPELRYIGFERNATGIGLCNLAYNMKRYIQLTRTRQSAAV